VDQRLRHEIYAALAGGRRAPTTASLAATTGIPAADVRGVLERLHAGHALVLDAHTREVRMAMPFSNVPTAYRVEGQGTSWDVNCAWDALAVVRLLELEEARLVDRGGRGREGRVLTVAGGELVERDGVISLPRPARQWWDDIALT
jgi:hypothetical protein